MQAPCISLEEDELSYNLYVFYLIRWLDAYFFSFKKLIELSEGKKNNPPQAWFLELLTESGLDFLSLWRCRTRVWTGELLCKKLLC